MTCTNRYLIIKWRTYGKCYEKSWVCILSHEKWEHLLHYSFCFCFRSLYIDIYNKKILLGSIHHSTTATTKLYAMSQDSCQSDQNLKSATKESRHRRTERKVNYLLKKGIFYNRSFNSKKKKKIIVCIN